MSENLSTYDYRVVKTDEGYSIYEVYYDQLGKPEAYSADPTLNFYCETVEGLKSELEIIKKAFDLFALELEDIGSTK